MVTITIDQNIKLSSNNYYDISSFMDDYVSNNFSDSNIQNEYQVASDMKNISIPDTFIKNFLKSYE